MALEDHDQAIDRLHALAVEFERSHPGAAGSLREGLAETLTVARLGITGSLKRTLARRRAPVVPFTPVTSVGRDRGGLREALSPSCSRVVAVGLRSIVLP